MKKEKISLALQGGGAHGAYTWGVVEKLLEEDVLDIRGFCGTSVGAVNSTLIVHGMQRNGSKGAIDLLEKFWRQVSLTSTFMLPQSSWIDNHIFNGNMDFSPYYQAFDFITNHFSPYQFNPCNINPLKNILEELVDFGELRQSKIKLFIAATKVQSGTSKVFHLPEINVNAVLASACLPYLYQTVEVNGEYYWDGGYTGNPPIYPLIYGTDTKDILLLQINPLKEKKIPRDVSGISDRINEISFNVTLMAEMRMIMRGYDIAGEVKDVRFHMVPSDDALADLHFSSKVNTSWGFLNHLRQLGRNSATEWIKNDLKYVGKKTCPLLQEIFGFEEENWLHEMVNKPALHLEEKPIGKGNEKSTVPA
ncbi:MAG: patatin-like phospholipase family protein [Bacteroidia bacterium]